MPYEKSHSLAAAYTEICLGRFAGTVHNTAHDSDLNIERDTFYKSFHIIRETDQIDLCPSASRAGNNFNIAPAQTERLQDPLADANLLDRIACE